MKGITHFTVGVAIASCFPAAVRAGADGNALYFLAGGIFGLLPDTLDFRLVRFLYPHHTEVAPDPLAPDAALIANAIADAVGEAVEARHPVRLKLDSIPLGEDQWLRYTVRFDVAARRVCVEIGDVVDTGGQILAPPPLPASERTATAALPADVHIEYTATTQIDIFDGPMFSIDPMNGRTVEIRFIPWHREWTHSIPVAVVLGALLGLTTNFTAGTIACLSLAAHGLVDHCGHLGTNLMFPFQKRRKWGLGCISSSHALGNFALTWAACVLIFWNLAGTIALPPHAVVHPAGLLLVALAPYAALRLSR